MTQEEIIGLVKEWQRRLKLDHWTLEIELDADLPEGISASITPLDARYCALLKLPKQATEYDNEELETCVIHELLHLHLYHIHKTVERLCQWHSREFQDIIYTEVVNEVELATDAISTAIYGVAKNKD